MLPAFLFECEYFNANDANRIRDINIDKIIMI